MLRVLPERFTEILDELSSRREAAVEEYLWRFERQRVRVQQRIRKESMSKNSEIEKISQLCLIEKSEQK